MQLTFLGGTGTVTGSKYLVRHDGANVLLDCGLFQGYKQLRLRNWEPLPIPASSLASVVLTHAHLDHSGYLPLLVKQGFRGPIYCTEATRELGSILLPDSGHLQEEDAEYANRRGFSKHRPALPLYTQDDAEASLRHFKPVSYGEEFSAASGIRVRLSPSGHILGSALVALTAAGRTIVFTGDLGRPHDLIMRPPVDVERADYLVVESTYGDRLHNPADPRIKLGEAVSRTIGRGGVVIIPSFAVGRAQSLLYYVHLLKQDGTIPSVLPVYLNSPMAADVTDIYHRHRREHRLTDAECEAMCRAATFVNSADESRALNAKQFPMVIIAASGMATGGRVLHHLKAFAPDARNTILFSGYQAGGTRGASIVNGATEVKIHGQYVPVRAEVAVLDNLSAHADYAETLAWLGRFGAMPRQTFVTHGEPSAADALRRRIGETLRWECRVPDYLEAVELA
ncbi:MAG: MBL fold metallo-hydrolase [Proteobacteria bacterium]|nr:MBL fold metallo-hydrolase [Pseudomonadota bacterium]